MPRLAHWREATVAFDTALTLKPDHAVAHLNYGVALAALNDLPRAAEHLQRAVQLQPDNPDAHAQLAEVLTKQGQTELARQHTETAARLRPPK